MRVSVIGCGRLGAPYAAALADLGHLVLGMDTDPGTASALNAGRAPFDEPGLSESIARHHASGALVMGGSYAAAVAHAAVHFVCVPTPQEENGSGADLRALTAAVLGLAAAAESHTVIVVKSSVPVGTTARLAEQVAAVARRDVRVELAYSPDFLRESTSVQDAARPSRIVLGVASHAVESVLREAWSGWLAAGVPLVVGDWATAELAKSAANAFLATKMSFVNAMAAVCEASGADVTTLAASLALDPRIGSAMLASGLGFGGSCIPKDIRALSARAGELEVPEAAELFRVVDRINLRRQRRVAALARELLGGSVAGRRIAVWGAAFKPGTDDTRESPALAVAVDLHRAGASVVVSDPKALGAVAHQCPALTCTADPLEALDGADLLLHLTEWAVFRQVDPAVAAARMAGARVIDARCVLDAGVWVRAGWTFRALGLSPVEADAA
ncbi:UDP-glucose dehydrogenase family protein [Streptomyces sp. NPDC013953]|uniref:UDP-glucose dehydrogenase family protein n=1 Tax=Streptomyces sp. NPDC013953 TaxID=3364868 RepID=UPI003700D0B7